MSKPSYAEMLKDPRWQEKRLRIMDRDGFTCRHCEDRSQNQQVHHAYYERGKSPWEYPDSALTTLCETCHKRAEQERLDLLKLLAELPRQRLLQAIGFLRGATAFKDREVVFPIQQDGWSPHDQFDVLFGMAAFVGAITTDAAKVRDYLGNVAEHCQDGDVTWDRVSIFGEDCGPPKSESHGF